MNYCLKLKPAKKEAGFRMDGYYVWCGSTIKEGDTYYLFAARWPEEKKFPGGYLTDSEIVVATTDDLSKPFQFKKAIITKRDGEKWDSVMAHNPYIFKDGDRYVLMYIGSPDGGTANRAVGYAYSDSLTGDWIRSETSIALPPDSNNPAIINDDQGRYLLYFRDGNLKVSVARSEKLEGPYEVLNDNLCPKGIIEDMFVFREADGSYVMFAEDAGGAYTGDPKAGVRFKSKDGINWGDDVPSYGFDVEYDDGSTVTLQRRERPFVLCDGDRKYLFTTAKIGGEDKNSGGKTWNMLQEIECEY